MSSAWKPNNETVTSVVSCSGTDEGLRAASGASVILATIVPR